jgi:formylglycine-generating enzyme required for sulfatase activity
MGAQAATPSVPLTPGHRAVRRTPTDEAAEVLQVEAESYPMVRTPAGRHQIGSPSDQPGRDYDEHLHEVVLRRPLLTGSTEVPQWLYAAVMGENPSAHRGDLLPVERVSWLDAARFCNALSEGVGLRPAYTISGGEVTWDPEAPGYRLPTETEWEALARADDRLTEGVPSPLRAHAWFADNAEGRTHPVGQKRANSWGLFDMFGNVYEWTYDWKGRYPSGLSTDPVNHRNSGYKVERGGSFRNGRRNLRVANRGRLPPELSSMNLGFRIVRNP